MDDKNTTPRKNWDFMIGIALVLFGSFRLYQHYQSTQEWNYKILFIASFIGYGAYLIFKHFKDIKKD